MSRCGDTVAAALPFRAAAALFIWSAQDADGIVTGNRGGIGFATATGGTAVGWESVSGARAQCAAQAGASAALVEVDARERRISAVAEAAFGHRSVSLNWRTGAHTDARIRYFAIGGADVTAQARWLEVPPGNARQTVTGLGFVPTLLLFVPAIATVGDEPVAGLLAGFGAATAREQAAAGYLLRDAAGPGAVVGAQLSGCSVVGFGDGFSIARRARVAALTSDGFDLEWSASPGGGELRVACLALGGVDAQLGLGHSPPAPGHSRTRTTLVRPRAIAFFSWGLGARDAPADIARLSVGFACPPAISACVAWDERDVPAQLTSSHTASSTSDVIVVTNTQTGGLHAAATPASVGEWGFALDWHHSDGFRRQFVYIAVGCARFRSRSLGRLVQALAGGAASTATRARWLRRAVGRVGAPARAAADRRDRSALRRRGP